MPQPLNYDQMVLKKNMFILSVLALTTVLGQQSPVEVTDQTIKVGALETQELYFGFAEGDEVVFSFSETNGKPLKTVKIDDERGNPKFSEFKVSTVENKRILVTQEGVFRFSLTNTSLGKRVCKVHIQRVPASGETRNFNTNVVWQTVYDTTYIPYKEDSLVGYDSIPYTETVKELISTEIKEDMILDKTQRVHSYYNENSSKSYLRVDLPRNIREPYRRERTVAWAYWIGVGDEGREAYTSNLKSVGRLARGVASTFVSPLAGLAIGAVTELVIPKKGEDVEYYLVSTFEDVQNFKAGLPFSQFSQGKGVAAYGKYDRGLNSTFFVALRNDNKVVGIDVNLKVLVLREIKTFKDITYQKIKVEPRYVTLNKQRMNVSTHKIRVCVDQN